MQYISYNTYCLKRQELMMDHPLPSSFDVVVIGTGLEESIVAAAAARNGHTVLHIDTNNYYGGNWAAFNFEGIQEWIRGMKEPRVKDVDIKLLTETFATDEEKLYLLADDLTVSDVQEEWFADSVLINKDGQSDEKELQPQEALNCFKEVDGGAIASDTADTRAKGGDGIPLSKLDSQSCRSKACWTKEKILQNSRSFNLDLSPRLLFSRGSMVELLISSNISRYTEFKSVSRVLTVINGALESVPSSRADVFATKHVSVVEKRILMKFLTFCLNYDTNPDYVETFKGKSFLSLLRHEKLTDNLIHFVQHSIAMVNDDALCEDGLKATRKFLASLGRFGNTPFLWSMYGSGELPQAFCRLCAVFGGTYYLGRSVQALVLSKDGARCNAIITNGVRISCDRLVMPGHLCPSELKKILETTVVTRQLDLLSDSVLPHEKEQLTFISIPPSVTNSSYTFMQEVGNGAAACPKEMYCFQSCTSGSCSQDLLDAVLLDKTKRLWSLKFQMHGYTYDEDHKVASNVFLCSGPKFELDYDNSIDHSRSTFSIMFPGEEFLPRAPEPEEIIIGGDAAEVEQTTKDVISGEVIASSSTMAEEVVKSD